MSRHDRAACLLKNGQVVGAIGEERASIAADGRSGPTDSCLRGLVVPPLAAITLFITAGRYLVGPRDLCVCGRSMTLCREALLERVPFPADRVSRAAPAGTPPRARLQRVWHGTLCELRGARDRRARTPYRWRLRKVHLVWRRDRAIDASGPLLRRRRRPRVSGCCTTRLRR